jgi:hypothetical protein
MRRNQEIAIHFERQDGEYTMAGKFQKEDEESVTIEGLVGDYIGKMIEIPKTRIVFIEYIGTSKMRDDYDEAWSDKS